MEKKDLITFLDSIFSPIGFKRKGNNWVFNGDEINKIINLQKSQYSNSFYINYGFIVKDIPLTTKTHFENRLASTDKNEQKFITDLLNLENDSSKELRILHLKNFINNQIIKDFEAINSKKDFSKFLLLLKPPYSNTIPLSVRQYFNIN